MPIKQNSTSKEISLRTADDFVALYNLYFDKIFAYVGYRIVSAQDVEDVVSTIFFKVLDNLETSEKRNKSSVAAWIFRIAHNTVVDYYRKNGNSQEALSLDDDNLPIIKSQAPSPDEIVARIEDYQKIFTLLNSLPFHQQEAIALKYFGNLKNKEIAEVLGIKERTVAANISRGLKKLFHDYQRSQAVRSKDHQITNQENNSIMKLIQKIKGT